MHNFKELKVWQQAMNLVKEIYTYSKKFPSDEKYCLTQQIQRAAISIPSNIAEGSGRNSDKEFIRFLDIAYGSSFELETQIILSFELKYITEEDFNKFKILISDVQKMIYGLTNTLQSKVNN